MATPKTYSPKELAAEIGIDAKVLRAYLRKNHTRVPEAKNTTWIIPAKVATAAKAAFKKNEASD
jgi:predicted site-specific integrase-resolvase